MTQEEGKVFEGAGAQIDPPKWTIMIYFAGDNNLSPHCIAIMQELEAALSDENVRLLACFDSNTPRPKGSRYLEINHRRGRNPTGMDWGLHNDLVTPNERGHETFAPDFCNSNPSTVRDVEEPVAAEGLARFLEWAMRNHRAQKHMLILFGHGTAVAGQTFLIDNNPPSFLRLEDLARLLSQHFGGKDESGKERSKLDILICNNCVMNGIETAYEVRNQVELMIGSQGLMLAVGLPYRKMIEVAVNHQDEYSDIIAREILNVCARNLLDFALMDRSLEQSVCDLTKFDGDGNIMANVKALAAALREGLQTGAAGEVVYPPIRDAVRLARLEAQSFWDETFVDLYDFCELLLEKCIDYVKAQDSLLDSLELAALKDSASAQLKELPAVKQINNIGASCRALLSDIEDAVPLSYYIGSELQYSHGLSIYFPWTLPEEPYFFEPVKARNARATEEPKNFRLKTAFDLYKKYSFSGASGWADFLESFFRATLRDVRRFDKKYGESDDLVNMDFLPTNNENAFALSLQKSSSDVSREGDTVSIKIKNYPRRNYLSPADCARKIEGINAGARERQFSRGELVSYLGWNIRGVVAEVVRPSMPGTGSAPGDNAADSPTSPPGSHDGNAEMKPGS